MHNQPSLVPDAASLPEYNLGFHIHTFPYDPTVHSGENAWWELVRNGGTGARPDNMKVVAYHNHWCDSNPLGDPQSDGSKVPVCQDWNWYMRTTKDELPKTAQGLPGDTLTMWGDRLGYTMAMYNESERLLPLVFHWCVKAQLWLGAGVGNHKAYQDDATKLITLTPSLLFDCCGLHGFVIEGQWMPA